MASWLHRNATAFKGELSRCQFCRISATITDAVRSCPQTLHFYLERLATPRLPLKVVVYPSYNDIYPAHACAARGYVIGRGLAISTKKNLNPSKYSLSEVHSNTGRLLIEFNRLQYTLAAPEVFVAFANPPSWYRVSIVRNTNIDRSKPHPYGIVDTVEHAYTLRYCTAS